MSEARHSEQSEESRPEIALGRHWKNPISLSINTLQIYGEKFFHFLVAFC